MRVSPTSNLLRWALRVDAAVSGATGLLMALTAGPLHLLLGIPESLLRIAGTSLLPFAAFLFVLSARDSVSRPAVWTVMACNALWAVDSVLLLFSGWIDPTTLGQAFVLIQALAVAAFAEAQYVGLRGVKA